MTASSIIHARLVAQQLVHQDYSQPVKLLEYMCAMQAQDFPMSRLALSMRTKKPSFTAVEKAINEGKIIRTHVMRPTWHLVAATELDWLIDLTAPRIRQAAKGRHAQLGLDSKVITKALDVVTRCVEDGETSREDLTTALTDAKINLSENRAAHLLMVAELEKVICSGSVKGTKQTYVSYASRVKSVKMPHEEAVNRLVLKYFSSRGPALVSDAAWWSGLPLKEIQNGIKSAGKKIHAFDFEGKQFYSTRNVSDQELPDLMLLPAYDEWLLSYNDRSLVIASSLHKHAVSANGIFYPLVLENGKVIGTWKPDQKKQATFTFFGKPSAKVRTKCEALAAGLGA